MANYEIKNIGKTLETITTEKNIVLIYLRMTEAEHKVNAIEISRANSIIKKHIGSKKMSAFLSAISE